MTLRIDGGTVHLGGRPIIGSITLQFPEGTLCGLLGPNGAGKSTLLRALAGLLPLSAGRVLIKGQDVRFLTRRQLARRLCYLPQNADMPFPFLVEDVVLMGRYAHLRRLRPETEWDLRVVRLALRTVDAEHLRGRMMNALSGGERRQVLLARTLASEAPIMLFDEPAASLDVRHALDLLETLRGQADNGKTIVLATHDLHLAPRYFDRFVLLQEGHAVASGTAEAILESDLLGRIFGVRARRVSENGTTGYVYERHDRR